MKKEVLLAISIGFALGLVITFGIWTANKSLAGIKSSPTSPTPTVAIATTPTANATPIPTTSALTITAPEDEAFSSTNSVTITGKATPGATVAVLFEGDDTLVLADNSGNFTTEVALIAGFNTITVSAFDASGAKTTQSVTVTYSTAKI